MELETTTLVQSDCKKRRLDMLLSGIISTDMDQEMDTDERPNKRPATSSQTLDSDNNDTTFASAEVSFDIDSDIQMQVIEPTEDQDNDVQPSPWNGVSEVGSSVNTQVSTLSNALQRVRESIEEYS